MLRFENHLYETQDKLFDKSTLLLATKMNPPTTRMVGKMRKSPSIGGIWTKGVSLEGTPSQTSMEPENHPSKKENLPKHNFLGSMLVLGSVYLHHLPPKKPLVFCPNWIGLSDLSTHTHLDKTFLGCYWASMPMSRRGNGENVGFGFIYIYMLSYYDIMLYLILFYHTYIYIYISCIYPFVMGWFF